MPKYNSHFYLMLAISLFGYAINIDSPEDNTKENFRRKGDINCYRFVSLPAIAIRYLLKPEKS